MSSALPQTYNPWLGRTSVTLLTAPPSRRSSWSSSPSPPAHRSKPATHEGTAVGASSHRSSGAARPRTNRNRIPNAAFQSRSRSSASRSDMRQAAHSATRCDVSRTNCLHTQHSLDVNGSLCITTSACSRATRSRSWRCDTGGCLGPTVGNLPSPQATTVSVLRAASALNSSAGRSRCRLCRRWSRACVFHHPGPAHTGQGRPVGAALDKPPASALGWESVDVPIDCPSCAVCCCSPRAPPSR
mmetsp:Transcript_10360/g.32899  ORF Transcript_10360/g.32899 Transcript_10360/m.32899 type:complete len:243 (-) Transcript_10360:58-786(-)